MWRVSVYHMRFDVPQFIEIEDKIIGPLTWKQFVYVFGGGGILLILYLHVSFFIFCLVGVPIGGLAAALAFQKINNRSFSLFLEAFFLYTTKHKLYFWKRDTTQTITNTTYNTSEETHL